MGEANAVLATQAAALGGLVRALQSAVQRVALYADDHPSVQESLRATWDELRSFHKHHLWLREHHMDYPFWVTLETLAICNAACDFCAYPTMERKVATICCLQNAGDVPPLRLVVGMVPVVVRKLKRADFLRPSVPRRGLSVRARD